MHWKRTQTHITDATAATAASAAAVAAAECTCACRYAPEKIPYAVERYTKEAKRLLDVLEARLKDVGGPYIMGQDYTIAGVQSVSPGWTSLSAGPSDVHLGFCSMRCGVFNTPLQSQWLCSLCCS